MESSLPTERELEQATARSAIEGQRQSDAFNAKRQAWVVWLAVGCVLWIGTPILGLAWITMTNQSQAFTSDAPAWVPLETSLESTSARVDIALLWGEPDPLRAPTWSGTVQSVAIASGGTISSGDTVAVIDGITRIAWHAAAPFYRVLQSGAHGADVVALKALLSARGQPQNDTDAFDWSTLLGVRKLGAELGVPDSQTLAHFDPAWVVFLSEGSFTVTSVALHVAAPAPSPGEPIADAAERLTGAAIVENGAATNSLSSAPDDDRALESAAFEDLVAKRGIVRDGDESLVYASVDVLLNDDGQTVSADGLEVLVDNVAVGTEGVPAQLVAPAVAGQVRIPAASISSIGDSFRVCIQVGDSIQTRSVTVYSSDTGGVLVSGDIDDSATVRIPGPSASSPCRSASEG